MGPNVQSSDAAGSAGEIVRLLAGRPILLVGMMGAGKTTVGRRLATRLGLDFIDSDTEIEAAAGMPIADIFASRGEAEFRAGEARVIARLLRERHGVIATGGGAFINPETRAAVKQAAVSVWLKADLDLLFARVSKRPGRPLLATENPRKTLSALIDQRYPVYAEADITVSSNDTPHEAVVGDLIARLADYLTSNEPS